MKLTLVAASAASALLVALPGTAFASSYSHADPAKDVQKIVVKKPTAAPTQKRADIVHLAADYTTARLTETTRLREIAGKWIYELEVKTPDAVFGASINHLGAGTQVVLAQGARQKPVTCDGLTHAIDTSKHTISLQIPASCLGTPAWMKVGAGMVALQHHAAYLDDALRKGGAQERNLTLSKRLKP